MTNLTLSKEMQNMAERLAENAHDIWAKKKKEELMTCGKAEFSLIFHKRYHFVIAYFLLQVEEFIRNWFRMTCWPIRRRERIENDRKSSWNIFNTKDTNCTSWYILPQTELFSVESVINVGIIFEGRLAEVQLATLSTRPEYPQES